MHVSGDGGTEQDARQHHLNLTPDRHGQQRCVHRWYENVEDICWFVKQAYDNFPPWEGQVDPGAGPETMRHLLFLSQIKGDENSIRSFVCYLPACCWVRS